MTMVTDSEKKWLIVISVTAIIIIVFMLILYYMMYSNSSYFFEPYDPTNNSYLVDSTENGLQLVPIPPGTTGFIDSNSATASQKINMINRALSTLQADGTNNGYLDIESTSTTTSYSFFIILIVIILIIIGCIVAYGSYTEQQKSDNNNSKSK